MRFSHALEMLFRNPKIGITCDRWQNEPAKKVIICPQSDDGHRCFLQIGIDFRKNIRFETLGFYFPMACEMFGYPNCESNWHIVTPREVQLMRKNAQMMPNDFPNLDTLNFTYEDLKKKKNYLTKIK